MAQTRERGFEDIDEEVILFLNKFLIEECLKLEPDLDIKSLGQSGKLIAVQLPNEQWQYFFDKKVPLLYLDLKLLIDGV